MFFLSLFLGVIDLLLVAVSGVEFIPRHLSDMRHVGVRFHGIAGEPRDAFVHLFFGLSLLYLRESWTGIKFKKIWVLIIASAALLTQSTSGLIGLCIAAVLIILYQIPKLKIRSLIVLLSLMTVSLSAVAYSVINSDRIQLYLDAAPLALEALERGLELPPIIMYQINNIYPVWIRWLEFTELNLGPLFFGSGLGSTSILNGYILTEGGVLNPHANIIRLVYEGGILGTLLFILAFVRPAQIIEKISNKKNLVYLMLLMLGVTFGHRSSALFTFLGIIITIHIFQSNKEPLKSDSV